MVLYQVEDIVWSVRINQFVIESNLSVCVNEFLKRVLVSPNECLV